MKKRMMGTGAAMLCGAMLLGTVPVQAAGTNYTGVAGTNATFDTYLVMDATANVPNATFTYAITAGTAKNYDVNGKKFEVLSGVGTPEITGDEDAATTGVQKVFTPADTTYTTVQSGDHVKGFIPNTQKYAKKQATIDFSSCTFTEPGIYRYVITESGTNQGITNDNNANRYLDVYVTDNNGTLRVESYVLHSDAEEIGAGNEQGSDGTEPATKSQGYTNTYATGNLTFREEVSGNQGSRDKYFAYTVTISGAKAGTVYRVNLDNADQTSGDNAATIAANKNKTNPTKLEVPAGATQVSGTFYLQHNQEITIQGLADNTNYDVTVNPEDYKVKAAGAAGYTDQTNGTINTTARAGKNVKTSYVLGRNGVIPTGVVLKIFPFAAMMLAGVLGVLRVATKRR